MGSIINDFFADHLNDSIILKTTSHRVSLSKIRYIKYELHKYINQHGLLAHRT